MLKVELLKKKLMWSCKKTNKKKMDFNCCPSYNIPSKGLLYKHGCLDSLIHLLWKSSCNTPMSSLKGHALFKKTENTQGCTWKDSKILWFGKKKCISDGHILPCGVIPSGRVCYQ